MPVLEAPRATYSASEGLRIQYEPAYEGLAMPQNLSFLYVRRDGVAKTKQLEPVMAEVLLRDTYTLLSCKSYPELEPREPLPLEAGAGGYGFWYKVTPDFKGRLEALFSSGDDVATRAAVLCFAAMDNLNPNYGSDPNELFVNRYGEGSYLFIDGPYRLRIKDGSVEDLYFGGEAGLNAAAANRQTRGDTIQHYKNDYAYQKMGLFLGMASLAHSVYRHSLLSEMDGLLGYELNDRMFGPCRKDEGNQHQQR